MRSYDLPQLPYLQPGNTVPATCYAVPRSAAPLPRGSHRQQLPHRCRPPFPVSWSL